MCSFLNMIVGAAAGAMQATIQNAQNDAQYTVSSAQTDAANMLSKDQADNNNSIRDAQNEFVAAQAALSNTQRSISNQNKSTALGMQTNALTVNQSRAQEAMVRGSVEQQISAAAQLGALRAEAATRGVGGTSADIMRKTMQGTTARLTTLQASRGAQITFDQAFAQAGVRSNLIMSQDYGQTVAAMNYQKAIAQTYITPMKMPDITQAQAQLMGAAGGGGFQQFSQSRNAGSTVGFTGGGVGNTPNYSSQSILNGVNSYSDSWSSGASDSSSGNSYNFNLGSDSGSSSSGSDSSSFNFSL